jgi:hypothetical protein
LEFLVDKVYLNIFANAKRSGENVGFRIIVRLLGGEDSTSDQLS